MTDGGSSYKLAEKLSDKLDEMGKDLKSMIEQINDASSTLSKTSKIDDPVSPDPYCYFIVAMSADHLCSSHKSSRSSTVIFHLSSGLTRMPRHCRPRLPKHKRYREGWVWASEAPEGKMGSAMMRRMISTDLTWEADKDHFPPWRCQVWIREQQKYICLQDRMGLKSENTFMVDISGLL